MFVVTFYPSLNSKVCQQRIAVVVSVLNIEKSAKIKRNEFKS